jgi:hypothetical protein
MPGSSAPQASRPEWFATTHWSVVMEIEIANTIARPDEIEAERRFLLAVLSR